MIKYSKNKNVFDEMHNRMEKIFNSGDAYIAFSGGKESLILVNAAVQLLKKKRIPAKNVHVIFIDEEAIYPCVERIVLEWREIFLRLGCTFDWICLPIKHFNCFNQLTNDESFICWDETKRDTWIREKPEFSIKSHKKFKNGWSYQQFIDCLNIKVVMGIRAHESLQRAIGISMKKESNKLYPIYDWSLNDVWLYLYENNVEIPEAYLYMWKSGIHQNRLRISQFFSIDTAGCLVKMVEYYPNLYEKIIKREPNSYLAMHYWDSEMFRRSTHRRKRLTGEDDSKSDWEALFWEKYKEREETETLAFERKKINTLFFQRAGDISSLNHKEKQNIFKRLHSVMESGDPKKRTIRSITVDIYRYRDHAGRFSTD